MSRIQRTLSPVDGRVYVERPLAEEEEIDRLLDRAVRAQRAWQELGVERRRALLGRMVDAFVARAEDIGEEITWQMGRPIRHSQGEIRGFEERARHMLAIAPEALSTLEPSPRPGFRRFIRRVPLGVVFTVAPWNYPYLCAVNSVVPALAAGNTVLLKHSSQTPLCAERMVEAAREAGLPEGVMARVHAGHAEVARIVADPRIAFLAFTGSVEGGRAVHRAAAGRFIACGLELGGKDPAYVRPDADLAFTVENLVDGSFYNAGQSCCGVERIYVHEELYAPFVEAFVEQTRALVLGDPLQRATTLGPMVRASAAQAVRDQIAGALAAGAKALIDPAGFPADRPGTPYLAPQVLVDVQHTLSVMTEESFGPVVGIMSVRSDEEAISLMNDSRYGLTASVWTRDTAAGLAVGERVETGTLYVNRCDYLDPALAWTGIKDSGRGCTLSSIGYENLTRPKSFHIRETFA